METTHLTKTDFNQIVSFLKKQGGEITHISKSGTIYMFLDKVGKVRISDHYVSRFGLVSKQQEDIEIVGSIDMQTRSVEDINILTSGYCTQIGIDSVDIVDEKGYEHEQMSVTESLDVLEEIFNKI